MAHRDTPTTFPVNKRALLRGKLQAVGRSPITWGGLAVAMGAAVMLPSIPAFLLGGTALGAAIAYWKHRLPAVDAAVRAALIEDSNEDQNDALSRGIRQLRKWKCDDYADTLASFLERKKAMESALQQHSLRTPADEAVETLADTLCNEVSRDLFKMADIRYTLRKRRKRLSREQRSRMTHDQEELAARVDDALKALKDAQTHLQAQGTSQAHDPGANPVLDHTIDRLREEAIIAKRVRERISGHTSDLLERSPDFDFNQDDEDRHRRAVVEP